MQVKLLMAREPGHVSRFWIQRVLRTPKRVLAKEVVSFSHHEARQLIDLFKNLEHIPLDGGTTQGGRR